MSPILGIWASQNYPRVTNSYESIATTTVGAGGSSTITFSSIPSTYKHLQLRVIARTSVTDDSDFLAVTVNSDTGANYRNHTINGNGSSVNTEGTVTSYSFAFQRFATNAFTSNTFGASITDIFDYTNTNKNKVTRTIGGFDANGSGAIYFQSGLWMNTSAITSLSITSAYGTSKNFLQYSSFALYGIKG